jgi:hypothetical protein
MNREPLPNQSPYAISVDRYDATAINKETAELFRPGISMRFGMKID